MIRLNFKLKNLIKIILLSFCLVMIFCSCSAKNKENDETVITINGKDASFGEYGIYLNEVISSFEKIGGSDIWDTDFDGRSAFDTAKENALNSLKMVKLTVDYADKNGISLTDEEKKQAENEANDYINEYGEHYSDFVRKVMEEKILYNKTRNELLKDYTISMSGFDSFVDENIDIYNEKLADISYFAVYFDSLGKADEFEKAAKENSDFNAVLSQYGISAEEKNEKFSDITDFACDISSVYEGSITSATETENGYAVCRIKNIFYPTKNEVKEYAKYDYEEKVKNDLFYDMLSSWEKSSEININNDCYGSIAKDDFIKE